MDAEGRRATVHRLRLARLMVELQRGKLLASRDACAEARETTAAVNAQAAQVGRAAAQRRQRAARSVRHSPPT
jgi:hypothetical protein